ncbi:hypothetical protein KEM60_03306 [Austwickia sp. TVS 96-490-7B]|uniref:PAS domain-containing protein n=1 Tax=Austwickia sp. TVS 96-490-7B TaxID=2830843 RepID=UPI001C5974CE|nr:PAS domain-containing protein [Austwickia sp. TVS 96-490-7B]MBW3087076.1 hypothetical protein [Austwickia sp. TVS 96-490-7B]
MVHVVEPTDHECTFGVDELFFSTTDAAGVIEMANSIFVRLSGYTHEELVGAPHNIVRHPEMPGGAYKLVWDQLKAGRPACAYMKNITKDGSYYWVFATLLPVGDKYLSVRKRPLATQLVQVSDAMYRGVREKELQARAEGMSGPEAAALGLDLVMEGMAPFGIESVDDLALATLPLEMAEQSRQSAGLPQRPDATGPVATLLQITHDIDRQTARLVSHLDDYAELVVALEASYADSAPASERLAEVAQAATEGAAIDEVSIAAALAAEREAQAAAALGQNASDHPPFVSDLAGRMTDHVTRARDLLEALGDHLKTLASSVRWLRMRIALLRLHNSMVGTFAAELIDGYEDGDTMESMVLLCRALTEGAADLESADRTVLEEASLVPALVEDAVRQADRVLRLSTKWRGEIDTLGAAEAASEPLSRIIERTGGGFAELRRFYDVAARCSLLKDSYDGDRLRGSVEHLRVTVEDYRQSH